LTPRKVPKHIPDLVSLLQLFEDFFLDLESSLSKEVASSPVTDSDESRKVSSSSIRSQEFSSSSRLVSQGEVWRSEFGGVVVVESGSASVTEQTGNVSECAVPYVNEIKVPPQGLDWLKSLNRFLNVFFGKAIRGKLFALSLLDF
jgi:hypothetical protein